MPYVENRIIHDADAHTMEPPEWLDEFASSAVVDYVRNNFSIGENDKVYSEIDACRELQTDEEFRSGAASEVMLRKNYRAPGAWDPADRSEALDFMGFASQLVFPTMPNTLLENMEHTAPAALTYETAMAANRAQIAFCSGDPRLLPVAYLPMQDLELAAPCAEAAIDAGAAALLIPNRMPADHAQEPYRLRRGMGPSLRGRYPGGDARGHAGAGDAASAPQQRLATRTRLPRGR